MFRALMIYGVSGVIAVFGHGCSSISGLLDDGETLAPAVSAKAEAVAAHVGGQQGFGGTMMTGYFNHSPTGMGFANDGDLADPRAGMMIHLRNESTQVSTCHLTYVASYDGLDEQRVDVEVPPGGDTVVPIPCCEIVGMGRLETPGSVACHLADGQAIDNTMSVPGFLNLDYECGQSHWFMLTPDVDDLDEDGDTDELIMLSQGMQMHMLDGGPIGHHHGDGDHMLGPHAGWHTGP